MVSRIRADAALNDTVHNERHTTKYKYRVNGACDLIKD
jgi:hypothetical protein